MAVLKYKDENGNYQPIVGINMQNEVVQTTGNSTTAVMSQKAVSDLIPAQASSSNQLADKEFVNSSITTATATYQGSYNLVSDLSLTISASHGQIETALNTAASGADKNDYCFVQIPTSDSTPTEIASVERYKHNGTTWSYEYAINNSGFTAAQWAAVNSNITSGLVAKLNGMTGTSTTNDIESLFGMNSGGDCKNIGLSDLSSLLGANIHDFSVRNTIGPGQSYTITTGTYAIIFFINLSTGHAQSFGAWVRADNTIMHIHVPSEKPLDVDISGDNDVIITNTDSVSYHYLFRVFYIGV